jgi:hypothetical protein
MTQSIPIRNHNSPIRQLTLFPELVTTSLAKGNRNDPQDSPTENPHNLMEEAAPTNRWLPGQRLLFPEIAHEAG